MGRNIYKQQRQKAYLGHVRPVKIQIAFWSESSLGTFWTAKDAKVFHADNEDSDQIERIRTFPHLESHVYSLFQF